MPQISDAGKTFASPTKIKRTCILHKRSVYLKAFLPAILWALAILVLSVAAGTQMPSLMRQLLSADKLMHAFAYFVLTALLLYGFRRNAYPHNKAAIAVILIASAYGAGMEILQYSFFSHRHFEIWDIVANIIGSFISVFVSYFFIK